MENILNLTKMSIDNIPNNDQLIEHKNKPAINKLLNVRENFSEEVMRQRAIELAKIALKAGVKSAFIGTTGPAGFLAILSEELVKRNIQPVTDVLIHKAQEKIKKEVKEEIADVINDVTTKIRNRKQPVSSSPVTPVETPPAEIEDPIVEEPVAAPVEVAPVVTKDEVDTSLPEVAIPVTENTQTPPPVTISLPVPNKLSLISKIKKFFFNK